MTSRMLPFIIFYSIVFVILLGLHFYVLARIRGFFQVAQTLPWLLAVILLALSFPACSLLEKFLPNILSRILYTCASTWLGVVFLLASLLLITEPLRLFANINNPRAGIVLIAIALLVSGYALINALRITIKEVTIPLRGLEQPLSVVQLSDIHVGTIHNSGYLKRIVAMTNQLDPDMVLITGDLLDGSGPVNRHTVMPLRDLQAKTFFTIGNHERYEGVERVLAVLADTGMTVLRNEVVEYKGIQIVGVDFYAQEGRKDNPIVRELPIKKDTPSVLMYHPPAGLEDARAAGISLQLSGHTHNGQLFPFTLLVKPLYRYAVGLHKIDDMYLYITPGTGTWGPPMRLGSNNEITLLQLVPAENKAARQIPE